MKGLNSGNIKGFTLIEVILSLAFAGIIFSIITAILKLNIVNFYDNDSDIEIQQQAQFIIGFIEDKVMESCGIHYIQDMNGHLKNNSTDLIELKKVIFKNSQSDDHKGYIFQLSKDLKSNTYNLKYGAGLSGTATVEVGNYIKKIEAKPYPNDEIFTEAKGIDLKLHFFHNERSKVFRILLYFRNFDRR